MDEVNAAGTARVNTTGLRRAARAAAELHEPDPIGNLSVHPLVASLPWPA